MSSLEGKTIAITGASRGLGAGIAKECLARGANVSVCARNAPRVDSSDRVHTAAVDVTNLKQLTAWADETVKRFSSIDLWLNNAGILEPVAPIRRANPEKVAEHLRINLLGVFHGTQYFARHVHDREGEGVLINISSGASTSAYEGWGAYCASKAGVDRLTEVVAAEEREHGLHAYSIAPGIIDTDMQALIRSTSTDDFPMVDKFHELKANDGFSSASFVADKLLAIAFDPGSRPDEVCVRLPIGK